MRLVCETRRFGTFLLAALLVSPCVTNAASSPSAAKTRQGPVTPQDVPPPVAKVVPTHLEAHGHVRIDNYHWLSERENPEVIAYLEAENAYAQAMMAPTEALQETLFEEISRHVGESDLSVPWREGDYWYYYRWDEGKEYPIYARKRGSMEAEEEILIDVNEIAEGHDYTRVNYPAISSNQKLMAFGAYTGRGRFATIRIEDLETGELLDDLIYPASANLAWGDDNRTLFYAKLRDGGGGPYQIYRHVLGTEPSQDELVHEESDDKIKCPVWRRGGYIVIESWGPSGNEWWYLRADRPDGEFQLFAPREPGYEYYIVPFGDDFYIRTNRDGATNFKLMRARAGLTAVEHWEEVIPHRDDVLLHDLRVFRDFLVVVERKGGLVQLRIRPWFGQGEHYLDFGEPAYAADLVRGDPDANVLRYRYTSLSTPASVYDYNMETREKELVKREEVADYFDPADYVSERLHATARDGARVPVSLVYHKEKGRNGTRPLLLYAYGSGGTVEAEFDAPLLSLIGRGFVYAIAHVRGGEELGRQWMEDGRLLKKKNTFTDFIDVAEFLIERGYTSRDKLFAHGASSGGLLMGAVANMRPDLFKGMVAEVPWVAVLEAGHGDLGNPDEEEYYWYMLSYSPYDHVEAKGYPNMLVTAGFYDKMVPYWQSAKWVAKLRALKTDNNVLLLQTNMEAGHAGASGRYERWRETAFVYAFLLELAGIGQ